MGRVYAERWPCARDAHCGKPASQRQNENGHRWGAHFKWPRRIALEGILRPQDARLAVEHGIDAVILSNHGGLTAARASRS